MRIVEQYSHLNGWEHIKVHKPALWDELVEVIELVDAEDCRTKESAEIRKKGTMLYSPVDMNRRFKEELKGRDWQEGRTSYWVTHDQQIIRKTMVLEAEEQKKEIVAAGLTPIFSFNQTDFVKERIAVEVQFGKYSFVAYDLFVKHMAFFVGDKIDVGVEILPMKEIQSGMSSGPPYYEGALYDLLRQGRSTPAVPLVLVGIGC